MPESIPNIQNEKYYKLLADNVTDLVAVYSKHGTIEYISPSVYQLLGYDPESVIGINPEDLIHPDDRPLLKYNVSLNGRRDDETIIVEYRLRHKNGYWVSFESSRKFIKDSHGKLVNILAVCRDISNKKQSEQKLRENEELYRMLADNIIDMVALYKTDGTRLYVSPSCFALLGYTPEELNGRNISEIVHPDDLPKFQNDVRVKAYKGVEKFITEARILHKNGTWLHCETTIKAIKNERGRVAFFVATTRDITEWKLAQNALKESEEKYRSLIESSDAMICMIDAEGRFVFANDKRAAFFGTTKESVIGKTIYDFYDKEKADVFNNRVQKVFEEKRKFVYESWAEVNSKEYWLRATLQPVIDAEGVVYAVMMSTIDITNIKATGEALRKQNDELKQIAFLQSHIVRSPLTNIQGIIALIDEDQLTAEHRFYMGLLKQATDKLDAIIKEIVDRAVVVRRQTMD